MHIIIMYIPYSLKILRVKIFVDFGVPTKILALKILSYSIIQCNTSAIHKKFYPRNCQIPHSMKILTLENFRLYSNYYSCTVCFDLKTQCLDVWLFWIA